MNKLIIAISIILILTGSSSAEWALVVAKDENYEQIGYQYAYSYDVPSWKVAVGASKELKKKLQEADMEYETISTLSGGKKHGHDLEAPCYYALIKTEFKLSSGKTRISYGLGLSKKSASEAESRAVKNMSTYNWNWETRHGYEVIENGYHQ